MQNSSKSLITRFEKLPFLKRTVILCIVSAVLLILFYGFSFVVKSGRLHAFDFDMTVRLSDKTPRRLDPYFSFLSLTGSFEIVLVILAVVLALKKRWTAFLVLVVFGAAHVVELFGKSVLHHPPPPFMFFRYDLGFQFPTSYVQTGNSYPSGHAMRMIFLCVVTIWIVLGMKKLKLNTKYVIIGALLVYAGLMLLSRIVLGEHWTSDVIGGSILGLSMGTLSLIFL